MTQLVVSYNSQNITVILQIYMPILCQHICHQKHLASSWMMSLYVLVVSPSFFLFFFVIMELPDELGAQRDI